MILKDYDAKDGKQVWLTNSEIELLIENADKDRLDIQAAIILAARCGLRRGEIVGKTNQYGVRPKDIVKTDRGPTLRVRDNTKENYRELPAPSRLMKLALAIDCSEESQLVNCDPSTIYSWVDRAAQRCRAETQNNGWKFVSPHDLRRSWANLLLQQGVLPSVVMEWGGWEDFKSFSKKYLNEFSESTLLNERKKIDWIGTPNQPISKSEGYSFADVGGSE